MLIPFESLSPNSRIWIYQSSRVLAPKEQSILLTETESFLRQWTAHGQTLQAGTQIFFDRFLIIGTNEEVNEASGCSIDKSVNFIKQLGDKFNIDFLDRSMIAYKLDDIVNLVDFRNAKHLLIAGEIPDRAEIFNNSIQLKKELDSHWIQPLSVSWLGRYQEKK